MGSYPHFPTIRGTCGFVLPPPHPQPFAAPAFKSFLDESFDLLSS